MDALRIPEVATARGLLRGQLLHGAALLVLVPAAWLLAAPALRGDVLLGVSDAAWLALGLAVPVVHQVYVWVAWRLQLGWNVFTRCFGDLGFPLYLVGFGALLVARPLGVAALGLVNRGSLDLPLALALGLAAVLALPAAWTVVSVFRWFGFPRAAGADHFDVRYRELPLVREGVFRYVPNAMYVLGFLALWAIALALRSHAALVIAAFQHVYIQVHWLATEKPDMEWIYGRSG